MLQKVLRTSKNKFAAPLAAMVLVGGVGAYVISASNAQTAPNETICIEATSGEMMPTLSPGASNECVSYLQSSLQNLSYTDATRGTLTKRYNVDVTGTYDSATKKAIVDFQSRLNQHRCSASVNSSQSLTPATDGTVDAATWYFATNLSGKIAFSNGSYSCGPGNLLAE